jgi:hypothetical protein
MPDKIYPINVTVYNSPKKYVTGLVYSEKELEEVVSYILDKKLHYTVAYREEDGENNLQATTGNDELSTATDAESNI